MKQFFTLDSVLNEAMKEAIKKDNEVKKNQFMTFWNRCSFRGHASDMGTHVHAQDPRKIA